MFATRRWRTSRLDTGDRGALCQVGLMGTRLELPFVSGEKSYFGSFWESYNHLQEVSPWPARDSSSITSCRSARRHQRTPPSAGARRDRWARGRRLRLTAVKLAWVLTPMGPEPPPVGSSSRSE